MKDIYIVLSPVFIFIIQCLHDNVVEARRGDVIPLGPIIGSSEMRFIRSSQNHKYGYEYDKAEFPQFRKRKAKKKHRAINNKNSLLHSEAEVKPWSKHKGKKRASKRFIKTTLKDIDKDSNLSGSDDNDKNKNPVDIIVHIKMKE